MLHAKCIWVDVAGHERDGAAGHEATEVKVDLDPNAEQLLQTLEAVTKVAFALLAGLFGGHKAEAEHIVGLLLLR